MLGEYKIIDNKIYQIVYDGNWYYVSLVKKA